MTDRTTCQFPALPKTVKVYKSLRSARIAVTKADNAFDIAMRNRGTDEFHDCAGNAALRARVEEYFQAAYANLEATVNATKEQGYYARSGWMSYFAHTSMMYETGNLP